MRYGLLYAAAFLFQGPLPSTCGNFWEMVWEQRSRGVVMLNRVIEKGSVSSCLQPHTFQFLPLGRTRVTSPPVLQIKCAQYWPHREERDAMFEETHFKITLVSEDIKSYYTVRQLELENLSVSV